MQDKIILALVAAKEALLAFESGPKRTDSLARIDDALAALSADQPQEQPVAWMRVTDITELVDAEPETNGWTPLYAAPVQPASKPNFCLLIDELLASWNVTRLRPEQPDTEMVRNRRTNARLALENAIGSLTRCATSSKEPAKTLLESHLNYTSQVLGHAISKEASEATCQDSRQVAADAPAQEPQVMGRVHNDEGQGLAFLNSVGRQLPDNTPLYATPQPAAQRDAVRNAALGEAAQHIEEMSQSAGDASAYDDRAMHEWEQGSMFALQSAAKRIRALQSQPAPEAGKQKHFGTIGHTRIPGMSPMFPTAPEAAPMPAQAVTLTDDEIIQVFSDVVRNFDDDCRTIEIDATEALAIGRRLLGSAKTGEANG